MDILSYVFLFIAFVFFVWIFYCGNGKEILQNFPTEKLETKIEIDVTPEIIQFIPNDEFDNFIEYENNTDNNKFCSKGEMRCKNTIEKIYGAEFRNQRPNFLKNPKTDRNLELDCYNEDLKIAIEYNGEQHYKWPNFFHKNIQEFHDQIEKDELKKKLCEKEGVHLIIVPYNIPHKNIPSFILQNLPDSFDNDFI